MMKYVIDGKFLTQKITGVQRYQIELIKALDCIVDKKDDLVLLTPPNAAHIDLKNIQIIQKGFLKGNLWEQIVFPFYAIKNRRKCLCLGNTAPAIKPGVVAVHDMNVEANPYWFSFKYRIWNKWQFHNIFKRADAVITVSNFSKSEISHYYPQYKGEIFVVPNGWDHLKDIEYNDALTRYSLKKNTYYFALGSMAPNKNFDWIVKTAQEYPEYLFVIAGMKKESIYGSGAINQSKENLRFLGYISDSDVKTLMRDSKGFLFPSLYEGFGIPPLEALSTGTDVLVSNIPVMKEIFENEIIYIDMNKNILPQCDTKSRQYQNSTRILGKYTWKQSADKLLTVLNLIEN